MTDREKLIKLLGHLEYQYIETHSIMRENVVDYLLQNGVTFATDTNVGCKWISVEDDKPDEFVSVLGHMTDAGDFPPVRECYKVGNVFFFPALQDIHPIDKWAYMPEPPKEDKG